MFDYSVKGVDPYNLGDVLNDLDGSKILSLELVSFTSGDLCTDYGTDKLIKVVFTTGSGVVWSHDLSTDDGRHLFTSTLVPVFKTKELIFNRTKQSLMILTSLGVFLKPTHCFDILVSLVKNGSIPADLKGIESIEMYEQLDSTTTTEDTVHGVINIYHELCSSEYAIYFDGDTVYTVEVGFSLVKAYQWRNGINENGVVRCTGGSVGPGGLYRTVCGNSVLKPKQHGSSIKPRGGFYLSLVEYEQLETKVLVTLAGQKDLIDKYNQGVDCYRTYLASKILNKDEKDVTDDDRKVAKAVLFAASINKHNTLYLECLSILGVDGATLTNYTDNLLNEFKELGKYISGLRTVMGYVETSFKRRLPVRKEGTALLKLLVGTSSDVYKLSMVKMLDTLIERDLIGKVLIPVIQDYSTLFEVGAGFVDKKTFESLVRETMESAFCSICQLTVSIDYGNTWEDVYNKGIKGV